VADYAPIYRPGEAVPFTAGGTITGGDVVVLSAAGGTQSNGTVVSASAASNAVVGVAAFDAASGARVTVHRGGVQEVISAAAITAPAPVKSAATGRVTPYTDGTDPAGQLIGLALTSATGAAIAVRVMFFR
jgi:hypothetical protein